MVRNPSQEKCETTLTSYYNINFLLPSLNPVMLNWALQSYSHLFSFLSYFPSSSWPDYHEAPWKNFCWVCLPCWLSAAKSVSREEVGDERSQHSHAYSPTTVGPAVAGALLASETCPCTHTFPRSCQNAAMQSQCPGEKAGMHLSYFPQKIAKMFNCSKSVLITTRWMSDGNLLSFLSAYPPKATLPETSIFWEDFQAHSQSPFDSGFQILLLSNSPDIKAPAPPTRKASKWHKGFTALLVACQGDEITKYGWNW